MKAAALAVALLPIAATAADLSIGPLTLGAPLNYKPCAPLQSEICIRDVNQLASDMWTLTIVLPRKETPSIMSQSSMVAYSKSGALVGVDFWTLGIETQWSNLEALAKKYGPPTSKQTVPVQNKFGAKYDSLVAIWTLDGLAVSYLAAAGRLDGGLVSIDLPAAAEVRAKARAVAARNDKPL